MGEEREWENVDEEIDDDINNDKVEGEGARENQHEHANPHARENPHEHANQHKQGHAGKRPDDVSFSLDKNTLLLAGLVIAIFLLVWQQFIISGLSSSLSYSPNSALSQVNARAVIAGSGSAASAPSTAGSAPASAASAAAGSAGSSTSDSAVQAVMNKIFSKGVPDVYGKELGISFDKVPEGLDVLAGLERSISYDSLSDSQKKRFVKIATTRYTACEFCCGIGSNGFGTSSGRVACGCAHNLAMSGLAKYLLKSHESEYTDEQIIGELQKWKALFFPRQSLERALQQNGVSSGGSGSSGSPSSVQSLPGIVGGC